MGFSASIATALDLHAARYGIDRDVDELLSEMPFGWFVLWLTFGLPIVSIAVLARRRWLALLPLIESLCLFAMWILYYATDWWSNPGAGWVLLIAGLVIGGWVMVVVAAALPRGQTRSEKPPSTISV